MNCQECHDYIDAYIDNELDISSTILVKQHLRDCPDCQQPLESVRNLGGTQPRKASLKTAIMSGIGIVMDSRSGPLSDVNAEDLRAFADLELEPS